MLRPFKILTVLFIIGLRSYAESHGGIAATITIDNGLSNSTVHQIFQDSKGFIWIATKDGLNRYDGFTFSTFRHDIRDTNSLLNNTILCIAEDTTGQMWYGTRNGLSIYKPYLETFSTPKILRSCIINALLRDDKNNIWVASSNGLWIFTPDGSQTKCKLSSKENSLLNENETFSLCIDRSNIIWVITASNRIFFTKNYGTHFENIELPADNKMNAPTNCKKTIYADATGNIWIGTKGFGAYMYNQTDKKISHYTKSSNELKSDIVFDFLEVNGELWIATDGGGINILSKETSLFKYLEYNETSQGLNSNAIYDLYMDSNGSIWIGTFASGINIYRSNMQFEKYTYEFGRNTGLSYRSVLCFEEDENGLLYIGTDGGGLNIFNRNTSLFEHYKMGSLGLNGNVIKCLKFDSKGNLWAGTYASGLHVRPKGSKNFRQFNSNNTDYSPTGKNIWAITEDANGNIWFAMHDKGVDCYDPKTGIFKHFKKEEKAGALFSNYVLDVFADSKNRIWIGTGDNGIQCYDPIAKKLYTLST